MNEKNRKLILESLDLLGVNWRDYKLPNEGDINCLHIVPVSGGSDSKCMALILTAMFPSVRFIYAFTDTEAEEQASYDEFKQIEKWCGHSVICIKPERGLYDLIEDYNGFLPSGQARYCTRILKLNSLDSWLEKKFFGLCESINLYVGIRFDEDRFGRLSDNEDVVQMKLPYIGLRMGRSQVYGLLAATSGISPVYKHSSRSSCSCCFFKRNSERVMQCVEAHSEFIKAGRFEKLSAADKTILDNSKLYNAIVNMNDNYFNRMIHNPEILIAKPVSLLTELDPNPPKPLKVKDTNPTLDMFDITVDDNAHDTVYAACMFLVYPHANNIAFGGSMNGSSNGVYFHKLVNYSRSLNGLKRSLCSVQEQILSTAELYGETQESMMINLRFGIYEIKVPKGSLALEKVDTDSYTWAANGLSYRSIQINIAIIHWILHREFCTNLLSELRMKIESKIRNRHESLSGHNLPFTRLWSDYKYYRDYVNGLTDDLTDGVVSWSGMFTNVAIDRLPSALAKARKEAKDAGDSVDNNVCLSCSL